MLLLNVDVDVGSGRKSVKLYGLSNVAFDVPSISLAADMLLK